MVGEWRKRELTKPCYGPPFSWKGLRPPRTQNHTKTMQGGVESATPEPIYGNCTEGGFRGPVGFKGFIERLKFSGSKNSTKLIKKLEKSEYPVKYLVYDASLP